MQQPEALSVRSVCLGASYQQQALAINAFECLEQGIDRSSSWSPVTEIEHSGHYLLRRLAVMA